MFIARILSNRAFDFREYSKLLGIKDLVLRPFDSTQIWVFYIEGQSTTCYTIKVEGGEYSLEMDGMASYEDYKRFPYLIDTLSIYLTNKPYEIDGKSAYQTFDEEWIAYTIGEEIAQLKCTLAAGHHYYLDNPLSHPIVFIEESLLNYLGVTLHSSTPRIYGYMQYMLKHDMTLNEEDFEEEQYDEEEDEEIDVPQHQSIGTVKSWQTDGAETTESYSQEDVTLLLSIAQAYEQGMKVEGVVLNDIGTIYEHGIGTDIDIKKAIYWYKQAIMHGDRLYAPTNLGDIFRKGLRKGTPEYAQAIGAYSISEDPYAWYRLGQSYEEGWDGTPNMVMAFHFYEKAAKAGHHLAIKRLNSKN